VRIVSNDPLPSLTHPDAAVVLVAERGVSVPGIQVETETMLRPVLEASVEVGRRCFLVGSGSVIMSIHQPLERDPTPFLAK
jgi:hypothetical protein